MTRPARWSGGRSFGFRRRPDRLSPGSVIVGATDPPGVEVDVSGLVCPQPNLVVRRCLAELEAGETLEVVGDYPPAERSIRRSCYKHGFPVADADRAVADEEFALRIRVPEDGADISPVDRAE